MNWASNNNNNNNSSSNNKANYAISDIDLKLFVKDVDDPHSRKRPLTVKTWATIKDVKDTIQKLLHVPPSTQRLYFGPLMTAGSDLPNHRSLADAGIYRNGETLYLEIKGMGIGGIGSNVSSTISTLKSKTNDVCISRSMLDLTPKGLRRLVQQARRGMAMGLKPDLVLDGSGGTYFLHDARKVRVAVFKPADEEPYAQNNPRGHVRQGPATPCPSSSNKFGDYTDPSYTPSTCTDPDTMGMRAGIEPGEACLREVAAYLLDHDSFTGVPMTTLAEARHPAFHSNGAMLNLNQGGAAVGTHSIQLGSSPLQTPINTIKKVGSLQEYVSAECCMDDLSPSKISTEEVHKIAVLDIRIMNADRNTANLICRRNPQDPDFFELIPIDHGYCLRTVADVCWFDWCWLDWPQLKQPVSQKTKDYILNLDIEADARMLKERLNIPERALDYFRASSKLLQAGIKCGMTLYDIAILCCRNDDAGELPSKLETLMTMADEISKSAIDNGRWHHIAASRALEQQLSPALGNRRMRKSTGGGIGINNMFKSKSSINFAFMNTSPPDNSFNAPAPMAQSSASDSSTEDDRVSVEDEECDDWAAAFIAGTLEPAVSPNPAATRRQRSISFARGSFDSQSRFFNDTSEHSHSSSSQDELSSSPVGFWYVPPSASKDHTPMEDDTTWSPHASPGMRSNSPELGEMPGLMLDRNRVVKFDMANLIPPPIMRSASMVPDKAIDNIATPTATYSMTPNLTMKRSQSCSAFSFKRITEDDETIQSRSKSTRENTKQLQHYFHKFIDLLIDREITPKIRSRQNSSSGDAHTNTSAISNNVDIHMMASED
jgi:hypothetical protein